MNEEMKKLRDSLSDEQKEKIKGVGIALPDEALEGVSGGMSEEEYLEFYSRIVIPMIDRFGIGHGDWQKQDKLEKILLDQYSPDKSLSEYVVDESLL